MATITTKYSIGDRVYFAGITTERKQHPCPDCKGERKWKALSPAGGEYEFGCPRCVARFHGKDGLNLDYSAYAPAVQRLTVGSVQFNTASGSWDQGARYMCHETGVGSGTVYEEAKLYPTEAEALEAAETQAAVSNLTTERIVKLYDRSLEISDYQLDSAALKRATEEKSRASLMLYNLRDLFATIEEAADKDAILEAVEDYKKWSWERDLDEARAASGIEAAAADETRSGSAEGESPVPKADAQTSVTH